MKPLARLVSSRAVIYSHSFSSMGRHKEKCARYEVNEELIARQIRSQDYFRIADNPSRMCLARTSILLVARYTAT
jgi:hypothetical protein